MGCLPTFGQIGYWAPVLLVVLRFLQGFAVGGEWGGAVLLVAEHSPNEQRAFWASWPQAAVPVGNMLATVVLLGAHRDAVGRSLPVLGLARSRSGCLPWWCWSATTSGPRSPMRRSSLRRNRKSSGSRPSPTAWSRCSSGIRAGCSPRWVSGSPRTSCTTWSSSCRSPISRSRSACDTNSILRYMLVAHAVHFVGHSTGRQAGRPGRSQTGVRRRHGARGDLGLLRVPDDGQRELSAHHRRHHHRAGDPRADVCAAAGDHGRDVPDPDAVFRCVPWLSGHVDRRGLAGTRSSPSSCWRSTTPRCRSRSTWPSRAAITLVAVFFTRETKGIDLEVPRRRRSRGPRKGRGRMTALERSHRPRHRWRERHRCGLRT